MTSVIGHELRRHRFELSAEEKIQEKSRQQIVAVMSERDLRCTELARDAIQNAATQARAQRAHRAARRNDAFDDAVGVLFSDPERHAAFGEISRQHVGRKARLLLVEIDRDDVEAQRGAILEREQDVEKPVAVLAARQADHHAVAFLDHREIADRLARQPSQTLLELVRFERRLARIASSLRELNGRCSDVGDIFHWRDSSGPGAGRRAATSAE